MKSMTTNLAGLLLAASMAAIPTAGNAQAVDEDGAKAIYKRNDCAKCHHPTREKKGAALQKIAEKYRGKPDAVASLVKQMTTGPKVTMLDDKKEEEHKIIDTKDDKQIKNLAAWILSAK